MPERRARMLAESTMPGADYQVPIRGRSLSGRGSAMPSFASEERESRQIEAAQPVPMAKAPSPEAEEGRDGSLHASRIWVRPQEIDDAVSWDDQDEMEAGAEPEFETEAGQADDGDGMVGPGDAERDSDPELVPVAASIFDDDFFNSAHGRNRAAGESEIFAATAAVQAASAPAPIEESTTRLFAGASGSQAEQPETDELDIPAFLRRSR